MSYFKYFPTQLYNGVATTNIIAKVKFDQSVTKNLATFYPYTIEEGQRADQIAEAYYERPDYDWLIYLSNDITDPYHEWPLTQSSLDAFIAEKHGSIANAQLQIAFYRNNYVTDDSVISPAAYEALPAIRKPYWAPILGYNDTIVSYQRKALDNVSETNKVVSLEGSFANVEVGSVIKQSSSIMGTTSFANSSTVMIKHVSGTWANSGTVYYAGNNATVNASITTVTTVSQPLAADELIYWNPVTYYQYHEELNESRKNIRLLDRSYVDIVERDMKALLSA